VSAGGGHPGAHRPGRRRLAPALQWLSWWLPPIVYALAIFVASSISQPPAPPSGVTDKHVHAVVYGGLALLLFRACARGWPPAWRTWPAAAALAAAVAYGAVDEWHQSFVPGRHPELADVAADALGAFLAIAGAWLVLARRRPAGRADLAAVPEA